MKNECLSNCPLQAQCLKMIETQNSFKAGIYNERFSLADDVEDRLEQSYVIESNLEENENDGFDASHATGFIAEQRDAHLDFVKQNNKQFIAAALGLMATTDKYIGRLERFSQGASKYCEEPRLRKRYVIFGEQIIKCSSPYRFFMPALKWLESHDTAAKAFLGHVKDN